VSGYRRIPIHHVPLPTDSMRSVESWQYRRALDHYETRHEAARSLGVSYKTMWLKRKEFLPDEPDEHEIVSDAERRGMRWE